MARNINMNNLLSSWVYLDDKDTSQNVIYVKHLFYSDQVFTNELLRLTSLS